MQNIIQRNNVTVFGSGPEVLMFAHGFGCNQQMWRFLLPELEQRFKFVLFDYVGASTSELSAFCAEKYAALEGYAQDIIDICQALDLHNVTLVGHSVSGIISLIAAQHIPERIAGLVMVCPSPSFLNFSDGYHGGFEREDLQELLDLMDKNYIEWANYLAPLVTGTELRELTDELSESFCSTNPITAKAFAKATFLSDHRALLPQNKHPVLLLQSQQDSLAAVSVGEYMQAKMPQSQLNIVAAKGHCLHMTHPQIVADAIHSFLLKTSTTTSYEIDAKCHS